MATLLRDLLSGAAGTLLTARAADSGATYTAHARSTGGALKLTGTGQVGHTGSAGYIALVSTAPGSAKQTVLMAVECLTGTTTIPAARVGLRFDAALASGYVVGYNQNTGRAEADRWSDNGTTITKTNLANWTGAGINIGSTVGALAVLRFEVSNLDANTVRIRCWLNGIEQTPYDDPVAAGAITATGRIALLTTGGGGSTLAAGHRLDAVGVIDDTGGDTLPTAATGLSATTNVQNPVLTWTPGTSGVVQYIHRLATGNPAPTDATTRITPAVEAGATTWTDTTNPAPGTWDYYIETVNAAGSAFSAPYSSTVPGGNVIAGEIQAVAVSQTEIQITETVAPQSASPPIAVSLERSGDGGVTWTQIASQLPTPIDYLDSGLERGTIYQYRAIYEDAATTTATSEIVTASTYTDPVLAYLRGRARAATFGGF